MGPKRSSQRKSARSAKKPPRNVIIILEVIKVHNLNELIIAPAYTSFDINVYHGLNHIPETEQKSAFIVCPRASWKEINYVYSFEINCNEEMVLNELCSYPIIVALKRIEYEPPAPEEEQSISNFGEEEIEKRRSTTPKLIITDFTQFNIERETIMGYCNIDLYALVCEERASLEGTALFQPEEYALDQDLLSWLKKPYIEYRISTSDSILDPLSTEPMNFITITLGLIANLPERFAEDPDILYDVALMCPSKGGFQTKLEFTGGKLINFCKIPKCQKYLHVDLAGRGAQTPIPTRTNVLENATKPDDMILQEGFNPDDKIVSYFKFHRSVIDAATSKFLLNSVKNGKKIAIEVLAYKLGDEPIEPPNLFLGFIDTELFWTVGQRTGHFLVPLDLHRVADIKTNCDYATSILGARGVGVMKSARKSIKSGKSGKSGRSSVVSPDKPPEITVLFSKDEYNTFVSIDIELFRALILRRSTEGLDDLYRNSSCRNDYFNQNLHFRLLPLPFPSDPFSLISYDESKKEYDQLFYNKMIEFDSVRKGPREKLVTRDTSNRVVQVLKDDFHLATLELINNKLNVPEILKCKEGEDQCDIQSIVTDAFMYIKNRNYDLSTPHRCIASEEMITKLRLFMAREFEALNLPRKAKRFYLINIKNHDPIDEFFVPYAIFNLLEMNYGMAMECVLEVVGSSPTSDLGFMLQSYLHFIKEEYELCEHILITLTARNCDFVEAWVALHMLYLKLDNTLGMEITMKSIRSAYTLPKVVRLFENFYWDILPISGPFGRAIEFFIRTGCLEFAEMTLIYMKDPFALNNYEYNITLALIDFHRKQYEKALVHLNHIEMNTFKLETNECDRNRLYHTIRGHVLYDMGQFKDALRNFNIVSLTNDSLDIATYLITIKVAWRKISDRNFAEAKRLFLQCIDFNESFVPVFGYSLALYFLDDYRRAEVGFIRANRIDPLAHEPWYYLYDMYSRCGREAQAKLALENLITNLECESDCNLNVTSSTNEHYCEMTVPPPSEMDCLNYYEAASI